MFDRKYSVVIALRCRHLCTVIRVPGAFRVRILFETSGVIG